MSVPTAFMHVNLIGGTQVIVDLSNIHSIRPNGVDSKANFTLRSSPGVTFETNHQFVDLQGALKKAAFILEP
ncbi:hypothetical protein [Phenylobacterium sp.]|uniref:hypothetical protein n=1 Tax=Phenylobacterium sp. TaxID=1871053 RepID=UPI003563841D